MRFRVRVHACFSMWRSREGDEARDSPIFEQIFVFRFFFLHFPRSFYQSPRGSNTLLLQWNFCFVSFFFYVTFYFNRSWRAIRILFFLGGEAHFENEIKRAVGIHAKINELGTTGSRHDLHQSLLTLPA